MIKSFDKGIAKEKKTKAESFRNEGIDGHFGGIIRKWIIV